MFRVLIAWTAACFSAGPVGDDPSPTLADERDAVRQAVALADTFEHNATWIGTMAMLARAQARCGDQETARATFTLATRGLDSLKRPRDASQLAAVIAECQAGAGFVDDARRSLARFRQLEKDAIDPKSTGTNVAVDNAIRAYNAIGDFAAAREVANTDFQARPGTTDKDRAAAKSRLDLGLRRIDRDEIVALLRAADPEARKRLVAERLAKAKAETGRYNVGYRDLAEAQAKTGDIAGAIATSNLDTKAAGLLGKSLMTHIIAREQMKLDRPGAASTLRAEIEANRTLQPAEPGRGGSWPRMVPQLLELLAEAESPEAALKLLEGFTDPRFQVESLAGIASVTDRRGDRDQTRALLDRADAIAARETDPTKRATLEASVAAGRARVGLLDNPDAAFLKMNAGFSRDDARRFLAIYRAETGDVAGAVKVVTSIELTFVKNGLREEIAVRATGKGHFAKVLEFARSGATADDRYGTLIGFAQGMFFRHEADETRPR